MYSLYYLFCNQSDKIYIGYTNNLRGRFNSHRFSCSNGKNWPLYNFMRKYGVSNIKMFPFRCFDNREEALQAEVVEIEKARSLGLRLLNVASGGEGGFVVPEEKLQGWKEKLSKARQGRKPSLGMKHTEANKEFFSLCNSRKVLKYPDFNPKEYTFKVANKLFGISKTHYYRLLKQERA